MKSNPRTSLHEENKRNPPISQNEVWIPLKFTDKPYSISNYGRVKSYVRDPIHGELLKGRSIGGGYLSIDCKVNGIKKSFYIHRLVAEYFIGSPKAHDCIVIHKDGDKSNNHIGNLEYCSLKNRFSVKRKYLPNYSETFVKGRKKSQKSSQKPDDQHDYYLYQEKYHRISDNGSCLFIRINQNSLWKSLAIAEILLEEHGYPKPSKEHKLAYRDWNYKNLSVDNIFWETQSEKSQRLLHARPLQLERIRKMGESHRKLMPSKKVALIQKYLAEGKSIAKISRLLNIGYTRLYNYVNKFDLLLKTQEQSPSSTSPASPI